MDTFKTLPDIINALNEKKMSSEDISKAPTDEMEELNISDDNIETGFIRNGVDGESFGFSPIVPEMIATVQDPTLLYFAIVCITFFGLLFMASTWKHWKNKTPKL